MFVVAGCLEARTGGSIYNRRMVDALRDRGWTIGVHELSDDFPDPSERSLVEAARVLRQIPDGTITVFDGLAFSAMPDVVSAECERLIHVPIVHMPLALETGLEPRARAERQAAEQRALSAANIVVVTGQSSVDTMIEYGVPPDRIAVVVPGTDRADVARGSGGPAVHLACVAALTAGKGHDVLLCALAAHHRLAWRLTCAGSTTRSPETAAEVQALAARLNIAERVTFTGELQSGALASLYDEADVFVLATRHETYGMAVAEALARGIPVVSTKTGEIPHLVGTAAGVTANPGDADAFVAALTPVLADAAFRAELHAGALVVRATLADWNDAACKMAVVLERAAARTSKIRSDRSRAQ